MMLEAAKVLYPKDPEALVDAVFSKSSSSDISALLKNMTDVCDSLSPRSIQRGVLVAVLYESYSLDSLNEIMSSDGSQKFIGEEGATTARKNFVVLKSGKEIQKKTYQSAHYKRDVVWNAVEFILSNNNTQVLSWGTRKININGKDVVLPRLVRKKVIEYMHKDYTVKYPAKEDRIGSISFKRIAQSITSHDSKATTAVDYVASVLLYDNLMYTEKIVATIEDADSSRIARKILTSLEVCM